MTLDLHMHRRFDTRVLLAAGRGPALLLLLAATACNGDSDGATVDTDGGSTGASSEIGSSGNDDTTGGSDESTSEDTEDPTGAIDPDLDPGRVTLHRLNRSEYNNTVRDLFYGLDIAPADDFPPDPRALGFDNIAEVLTLSPVQFELYERAADNLLTAALHDPGNAAVRDQLIFCDADADQACASSVIRAFADRAWRRSVDDAELELLVAQVGTATAAGGTAEDGVELAFKHALLSVHFLFRVELDEDPTSDEPHLLGDFELASRLSYFLWSSMPDDELFELARAGELQNANAIEAQTSRMLADPKADAFVDNFAGQWLSLRGVRALTKDATLFPEFTPALSAAMATESELFFRTFLEEERPFVELLTADETFVNDELADFYGLPSPGGDAFERVSVAGTTRKGLLTQAGVLSILSPENKTNPTVRGAWVLSQMLCSPPSAPPNDVPELDESPESGTVREQLDAHRENPACAGCHLAMDPIGLAFENYDAIGRYRTEDRGEPIDASGEWIDGTSFDDALELVDLLAANPDAFSACVTKQMLTYALGREFENPDDDGHIDNAAETFSEANQQLPVLVSAITQSGAFRTRRGESE